MGKLRQLLGFDAGLNPQTSLQLGVKSQAMKDPSPPLQTIGVHRAMNYELPKTYGQAVENLKNKFEVSTQPQYPNTKVLWPIRK